MAPSYSLGLTTCGWFEVEAFDADGGHVLRRHVATIEQAATLLTMPITAARASDIGLAPRAA